MRFEIKSNIHFLNEPEQKDFEINEPSQQLLISRHLRKLTDYFKGNLVPLVDFTAYIRQRHGP